MFKYTKGGLEVKEKRRSSKEDALFVFLGAF